MRNNDNTDGKYALLVLYRCLVLGYLEIFHQLTSTLDVRERQPDLIFVLLYSS